MSETETPEYQLTLKTNRVNELRSKMYSGESLTDEELQEGIDLVVDIRGLRAGKVKKDSVAKSRKEVDVTELF